MNQIAFVIEQMARQQQGWHRTTVLPFDVDFSSLYALLIFMSPFRLGLDCPVMVRNWLCEDEIVPWSSSRCLEMSIEPRYLLRNLNLINSIPL